jgi:hypothetical protein
MAAPNDLREAGTRARDYMTKLGVHSEAAETIFESRPFNLDPKKGEPYTDELWSVNQRYFRAMAQAQLAIQELS